MRKLIAGVSSFALLVSNFGALAHPDHHDDEPVVATPSDPYQLDSDIELLFDQVTSNSDSEGGLVADRFGSWGVDLTQKRADIAPGNDFFRHINGRWLDSFVLPDDKSDFGSFNALGDLSDRRVKAIIEEAAAARRPNHRQQQLGALYASFMNTDRLDRLGLAPLKPMFDVVDSARTPGALLMLAARTDGVPMPFGFFVSTDRRDTTKHQLGMSQGGLGMGERDFYLSDGSNFPAVRAAYITYLTRLFELSGHSEPAAAANRVFEFEKQIAQVHWTRADNRDPTKTLNTRTLNQLAGDIPSVPWVAMLTAGGVDVSKVTDLNVGQPSALAGTVSVWNQTPIATLKEWSRARILANNADYLPKAYRDASFEYRKVQTGQPVERPRDKRGVDLVNGSFGDAIGQIYVDRYFPQASREAIAALVANVRVAIRGRLAGLAWMSDDTRREAQAKLDAFTIKVGVPEVWDNKDSVRINRNDLVGNMMRLGRWSREDNLSKLGKPVDKREWGMTPQTVNAYYSPAE
jgi:putative endopeptidase